MFVFVYLVVQWKFFLFNLFILLCLKLTVDIVVQDGDRFWRTPECYIRGNTIKYLRVPDEVSLRLNIFLLCIFFYASMC